MILKRNQTFSFCQSCHNLVMFWATYGVFEKYP
jgi:hypothetical protein